MQWSDEETSVLVDAWGPMYLGRKRGSLRMEDWDIVCSAVNAHHAATGLDFNRNPAGCKRRICTLKARYKEEAAKGQPTSGWRHYAHLRAFLADPDGPPPGFAAKTPAAFVKKEKEEEVEEANGCVGGSVGTTKVPAKRHYSSLQDILERSGGPSPGKMPTTVKEEEVTTVKEDVLSCGCELVGGPAAVVTKLAEVYDHVETERLKLKMEMLKVKKEEMEDVKLEHKKVKEENPEQVHGS